MTREEAFRLVEEKVSNKNLRKHMVATEAVMRSLARYFEEDENKWGLTGLIHDLDYDQTFDDFPRHGLMTAEMLENTDISEDIIYAVKSHPGHFPRKSLMDKALYAVDPVTGLQPYQCRQIAFGLEMTGGQIKDLTKIMLGLYRLFTEKDLSLVEINPLVVTEEGALLALDAKINLDDNALFRHKDLEELRDPMQEDPTEHKAQQFDLNYVTLDGNIGCMVNGAGLAMATMDLIKLHGGEPANFLDVGGGTTAERVAEALKLIVADEKVKAILVNIFGGIVRCDLIAEGILQAIRDVDVTVPVVVRLEGTNAEAGLALIGQSSLAVQTASDLTAAAEKVVTAAMSSGS